MGYYGLNLSKPVSGYDGCENWKKKDTPRTKFLIFLKKMSYFFQMI